MGLTTQLPCSLTVYNFTRLSNHFLFQTQEAGISSLPHHSLNRTVCTLPKNKRAKCKTKKPLSQPQSQTKAPSHVESITSTSTSISTSTPEPQSRPRHLKPSHAEISLPNSNLRSTAGTDRPTETVLYGVGRPPTFPNFHIFFFFPSLVSSPFLRRVECVAATQP